MPTVQTVSTDEVKRLAVVALRLMADGIEQGLIIPSAEFGIGFMQKHAWSYAHERVEQCTFLTFTDGSELMFTGLAVADTFIGTLVAALEG